MAKKYLGLLVLIGVAGAAGLWFMKEKAGEEAPQKAAQGISAPQGRKEDAKTASWENALPEVREALKKELPENAMPDYFKVVEQADLTGDGAPEALIRSGAGATTEFYALMRFEEGKPVLAQFREEDGTLTQGGDLSSGAGGGGRYGSETELLPAQNAVFSGNYSYYGNGNDGCTAAVYRWNEKTNTFEFDGSLTAPRKKTFCEDASRRASVTE